MTDGLDHRLLENGALEAHRQRRVGIQDATIELGHAGELDDQRLAESLVDDGAGNSHVLGNVAVDGLDLSTATTQQQHQPGLQHQAAHQGQARVAQPDDLHQTMLFMGDLGPPGHHRHHDGAGHALFGQPACQRADLRFGAPPPGDG